MVPRALVCGEPSGLSRPRGVALCGPPSSVDNATDSPLGSVVQWSRYYQMGPKAGDFILRQSGNYGFELFEAATERLIADKIASIPAAIEIARRLGGDIWQQMVDKRGRPLGDPFRLFQLPQNPPA